MHHLLERINEKVHKRVTRVPPEVLEHLTRLPWRGNVRELENVLTRAVVLAPGEVLLADDLPALEPPPEPGPAARPRRPPGPCSAAAAGRRQPDSHPGGGRAHPHRPRAMAVTKGHKGKACQILGISRPTLERKLQKYGLAAVPTSSSGRASVRDDAVRTVSQPRQPAPD